MKKILCALLACLLPLTAFAAAPEAVVTRAVDMIGTFESNHNYGCIVKDTNGSPSVGFFQWNAARATALLKDIISADAAAAQSILGDALYTEIAEGSNSVLNGRPFSAAEKSRVAELLTTDKGKSIQNALAKKNVAAYVEAAMALGIVNKNALCYYADIRHQVGSGAVVKYTTRAREIAGSYEKVTLDDLYQAALAYATYTKPRRTKAYNQLKENPVGGDAVTPTPTPAPEASVVTSLTLSGETRMKRKTRQTIVVTIEPASAAATPLLWKSGNRKIAVVSQKGVVLAKKAGKVNIFCRARDKGKATAKLKITVTR